MAQPRSKEPRAGQAGVPCCREFGETGIGANTNNPNAGGFNGGAFEDNPIYLATLKDSIPTLSTASYVNWTPIENRIIASVALDGNPGNDLNFHEAYGDGNTTAGFDDEVIDATLTGLGDVDGLDPDAVFVSIDLVDYAGHHIYQGLSRGSSGAGYKKAIEEADAYLGQVLGAIANRPDFLNEDWQIVVTSDHGHRAGGGHSGQTALERTIPLIVASQNLIQGDLPLGASQADVAPTILNHFGVASPSRYAGVSRAGGAITLTGDYNHDGFVNAADYTLWRDTLGQSIASGTGADGNNNGVIDMADYTFWKGNFGNISGNLTATNAVPEPATAVLGLLGLVGLAGVARRASRSAA